jgi:signal transduction histidine kinase
VSLIERLRRATSLDWLVAGGLTIGALAQVPTDRSTIDLLIGVVCAAAATSTVAWRRRAPALAVAVAVAPLLVYQLATSDTQMTFVPYAVLLTYYTYGRGVAGRSIALTAALFGLTLVVFAIAFAHLDQGSFGNIASAWLLFALIPCGLGAVITRRATMSSELAKSMLALRAEQALSAAARADDERYRIARELHDVIAHCVSVMVIQASGARLVMHRDVAAARSALAVVVGSGREALADLRRITGVWHREDEPSSTPGLSQLESLVERTRDAGLPATVEVHGDPVALAADADLVALRVVQEALTNAVKHAGRPARADIRMTYQPGQVEIHVINTGSGPAPDTPTGVPGGHGLLGMRERVTDLGGDLRVGPTARGGWEVYARLPAVADGPALAVPERRVSEREMCPTSPVAGRRWLDVAIAGLWLIALEVDALTNAHAQGPVALNVVVVGIAAVACAWRRRHPLVFIAVAGLCAIALSSGLTSDHYATVTGTYGVLIPSYAVGSWMSRRHGLLTMGAWVVGAELLNVFEGFTASGVVGPLMAGGAAFAAGRLVRSQRQLSAALRETSRRLVDERADRERLAVAGARARLTRELHERVARGVTAMVVQAEAAAKLLGRPATSSNAQPSAVAAMAAVETSGREVLGELRGILGVLRRGGVGHQRTPQPGLDQVHELVERSRDQGRPVELEVDGEPGTLLAGLDLVTYRILEDVLADSSRWIGEPLRVVLRFSAENVEISLRAPVRTARSWPSAAVRRRIAMFNGDVEVSTTDPGESTLLIRLPRLLDGALA